MDPMPPTSPTVCWVGLYNISGRGWRLTKLGLEERVGTEGGEALGKQTSG